jgi:hypothetical protein
MEVYSNDCNRTKSGAGVPRPWRFSRAGSWFEFINAAEACTDKDPALPRTKDGAC